MERSNLTSPVGKKGRFPEMSIFRIISVISLDVL